MVDDVADIKLWLPDEIDARLTAEAHAQGRSRSEVIRVAIVEYVARRERERFMADLVAEARTGYGDGALLREAKALAEEAVAASNDALDLAEGRAAGDGSPENADERWWR